MFVEESSIESKGRIVTTYFYNGWICDIDDFFCSAVILPHLEHFSFVGLFAGWVGIGF
jgi:hypothetical protein